MKYFQMRKNNWRSTILVDINVKQERDSCSETEETFLLRQRWEMTKGGVHSGPRSCKDFAGKNYFGKLIVEKEISAKILDFFQCYIF